MVVDHAGLMLFDNNIYMRLIGRLAFPIFALYVGKGAARTKNISSYGNRLLVLALVSQPVHAWAIGNNLLNVVFMFWLTVQVISLNQVKNYKALIIAIAITLLTADFVEYGLYTMIIILIAYKIEVRPVAARALSAANVERSACAKGRPEWKKYIYYIFYPLHLLILKVILIMN